MAKRVGYEEVRLADLTEQLNKEEAQRQKMRRPRSTAAPSAADRCAESQPENANAASTAWSGLRCNLWLLNWQITGVRQDAYAKAHPLVVEQAKNARERGHYLHPELHGASEAQNIEWARHPEMMKKMQETRARQLAAAQGQTTTTRADTLPLAVPPNPKPIEPSAHPVRRAVPVRPAAGPK